MRLVRVAALYDIHGNVPALEAVLGEPDVAAADLVVVGGDVVAGPMPAETLRLLDALGERIRWVRGNTDREVVAGLEADPGAGGLWDRRAAWVARQIEPALAAIAAWPPTVSIEVDGLGPVLFCHGSPRSDEEIITRISPPERIAPMLEGVEEPTVVGGHTHVQFDRRVGERRVVNAGAVGMAYEDSPGARWCLLGPGVELRTSAYDVSAAAERIRATGFPDPDEFAQNVVRPESPEEASRVFEEMASGFEE